MGETTEGQGERLSPDTFHDDFYRGGKRCNRRLPDQVALRAIHSTQSLFRPSSCGFFCRLGSKRVCHGNKNEQGHPAHWPTGHRKVAHGTSNYLQRAKHDQGKLSRAEYTIDSPRRVLALARHHRHTTVRRIQLCARTIRTNISRARTCCCRCKQRTTLPNGASTASDPQHRARPQQNVIRNPTWQPHTQG